MYEFVSNGVKSDKIKSILTSHKYTKNWCLGKDSKENAIKKPYTFMKTKSLDELEKEPIQCDIWDIGGCGCFVDYGNEMIVE